MKLIIVLLLSTFFAQLSWGATCRNDFGTCTLATGNGSGCRMNDGRACWVKSDAGLCRKIINSSGQVVFIGARTNAELDSVPAAGTIKREAPGTTWCQ